VPWRTLVAIVIGFLALGLLASVVSTGRLRAADRTPAG
jgi:hypothetical protein